MGVSKTSKKSRHLSDMSDNTEDSDFDRHVTIGQILGQEFESKISEGGETSRIDLTLEKWRNSVEGRELANEVYPMSVDQLFTLLFTNSKFYMDFHVNRKTFGKTIIARIIQMIFFSASIEVLKICFVQVVHFSILSRFVHFFYFF